eukprot:10092831-Karenia_brevis.AAC.1
MGMEDADDDMWELEDDEAGGNAPSAMGVLKHKPGAQSSSSGDGQSLAITDCVAGAPATPAKALMHI